MNRFKPKGKRYVIPLPPSRALVLIKFQAFELQALLEQEEARGQVVGLGVGLGVGVKLDDL